MTFAEYEAQGWRLCAIEPGKKGPVYDGWNTAAMPAETIETLGQGAGLLHSLSGTCAIDIDDISAARAWWAEHGVDIDALCDAPESVHVRSGRAGRDKLIYKLSKPLRTLKPKGSGTELRCATAGGESVQDVLPPSIHPITKRAYFWHYGDELVGHWSALPNIPANVFRVWRDLVASEPVREVVNEKPQAVQADVLRKAVETFIASRKLDIDAYDDWIEIGMRVHKQTNGASQGLMLWNEISKPGKKYKDLADLKMHWVSFDATGLLGLDAAIREVPATRDDFEDVHEAAPDEETTAIVDLKNKSDKLKAAREWLESRLVLVASDEAYFDTDSHKMYRTMLGIEHMFTCHMPPKKSAVKVLLESKTKTIVDRLGFHPGESVLYTEGGFRYANLYRNELPEPVEPTADELDRINWLFERIDDARYREWLLTYYAYVVQHPGVKIKSAPLIWSETQGNGKSTLVGKIPALLVGRSWSRDVNTALLNSDFNDFLLNAWHVNLAEFRAGRRDERDAISKKVENWIADDIVGLHPKGRTGYAMPNHFFVTASSNADDAALLTGQDRKWAVHELKARQFTEDQQKWIYDTFLNTPRAAAVLRHFFLNISTATFNPSAKAPETTARTEMIDAGTNTDLEMLKVWFEERTGLFAKDAVKVTEVLEELRRATRCLPSLNRVAKLLSKPPFNAVRRQIRDGAARPWITIIRNQNTWTTAGERDLLAHMNSDEISVEDDLLN